MHKYLIAVILHWLPKWQDRCYRVTWALLKLLVYDTVATVW